LVDVLSERGFDVSEKAQQPKPDAEFFDFSWDSDAEAEDAQQILDQDLDDDDVEAHGFSGFNSPE
jgi:hypothetical protein